MRSRCTECREWATHRTRCATHHKSYLAGPAYAAYSARRAAVARGTNGAATLRAAARTAGFVRCATCLYEFLASAVDIDHIVPLSRGGEDVDGNVQILCRGCHSRKTAQDMDYSSCTPF